MEVWREEEMVTVAEDSMLASATANPIPDVPPMIRICFPASLLYFCVDDDILARLLTGLCSNRPIQMRV